MEIPSRKHVKSIIFVVAALAIAGAFTAFRLPVSLFPDVAFPRISVAADAGEMPADRMMITCTRKLEEALNSVPDVVSIRSTTSRGTSELSVNFHWNVDMVKAELQVSNALNQIKSELPANCRFTVRRMNPTVFPIIGYSLVSRTQSLVELRTFGEFVLRPVLTSIDGVADVVVLGGRTREYEVLVNPERMRSYQLSLEDLGRAIAGTNVVESVGTVTQDYKLYLALADGQYANPEEIGQTVIKVEGQMPVFLDDVAVIRASTRPEWTRVTSNGREAVLLNVYQQPGGNTVKIDTEIKNTLAAIQGRIPPDITISKFYDQSDLIVESMKNVRDSILIGVLLAVAVLFVFLRSWGVTLIASLNVPLTIAITVVIMRALNMSFNIMTLGGIAAAIGLIIDDAIVVVENVARHVAKGHGAPHVAVSVSVKEILRPVVGSSFSTIVVFAPLTFLTGVTGAFFKSLSLTMAASLLVSMFLALFVVPILAQHVISGKVAGKLETEGAMVAKAHRYYETILGFLLRRRYVAWAVVVLLAVSGFFLYHGLPSGFLPKMDEGTFILDYRTQPGTSLEETDRILNQIEDIIRGMPEISSYSRRTGLQLGGGLTEANMGDFLIRLSHRRRGIESIMDDLRKQVLTRVPGIEIEFAQLMGDLIGDLTAVPQPIEIKVFGDSWDDMRRVSQRIVQTIEGVRGVVDVYDGVTIAGSALLVKVDPVRAGLFGVTTEAVQKEVESAVFGAVASEIQEGQVMTGIRVRLPLEDRKNLERIGRLRILTPDGEYVSLGAIADLSIQDGQPELSRESLKQMIAVTARISDRDMGSTLKEIQSAIKREVVLPPGLYIEYGGLYREQQKSFRGLLIVLAVAIVLVFMVQLFEFESFKIPVIILLVDVLSLFGVFLFLRVTGIPLNISSMMGMIMIVGIVAENAIFFVHFIELFRREGLTVSAALIEAGKLRLRPIIMTTLAAVLALMPLAVGLGAGAQMQQPLAVAVIGGFSFSAVLLLFLLPVFYASATRRESV